MEAMTVDCVAVSGECARVLDAVTAAVAPS
jgi:hypothetical protein